MARPRDDEVTVSESTVLELVLRRLSHAPRTRAELSRDLTSRGIPIEVSDSVLDGLERSGLIDDDQFARMWVESRHRGRGLARGALRRELTQRGVDPDTISEALGQVDEDSELARARELADRRLRVLASCDPATKRRRLTAYLARRGYSGSVITTVVADVLATDMSLS